MIECWNHVTDFNQQYDQLIINLIDVQRISEIFTSGRDRIYQLPGQVSSIFRSPPWSLISWSIVIGWFRNAFVHFNLFFTGLKIRQLPVRRRRRRWLRRSSPFVNDHAAAAAETPAAIAAQTEDQQEQRSCKSSQICDISTPLFHLYLSVWQ